MEILELALRTNSFAQHSVQLLIDILPDQAYFESELASLSTYSSHPSLAVLDPFVPSSSSSAQHITTYDSHGLSSYARSTLALHHAVAFDRQTARKSFWAIRHFSALEVFTRDYVSIPNNWSPLFAKKNDQPELFSQLRDLSTKTQQTIMYMLSSASADLSLEWHKSLTTALRGVASGKLYVTSDGVAAVVASIYSSSVVEGGVLNSQVLHTIIRGLLREATAQEADLWLGLAQTIQDKCRVLC